MRCGPSGADGTVEHVSPSETVTRDLGRRTGHGDAAATTSTALGVARPPRPVSPLLEAPWPSRRERRLAQTCGSTPTGRGAIPRWWTFRVRIPGAARTPP